MLLHRDLFLMEQNIAMVEEVNGTRKVVKPGAPNMDSYTLMMVCNPNLNKPPLGPPPKDTAY